MVLHRSRAVHVVWKTMFASQVLMTVAHGTARSIYCMDKYDLYEIALKIVLQHKIICFQLCQH